MHRDDDAQRGSLHDRCRLCHQFKPMVIGDQLCYICGDDAPMGVLIDNEKGTASSMTSRPLREHAASV